ncbi:response regulator [Actinospica durhamensis]|uniref:Transcriptional regulatory protein n=1 Tax=Actinospica durhamensis TaxID=1508375 RepID=A0A941IPM9_9ACTN|nr:response regulator [Actinospica durhamensis]MBR7832108.1 response regulator [Actinospica durhamensis]
MRIDEEIRTLVVDDDFRVARIHAAFVERTEGFALAGVTHGAEQAFEAIDELRPDLVLMDVHLPDGDGVGVVRDLAHSAERPDFIIITAAREVRTVRAAMQAGALHYLVKPFGYQTLREKLMAYRDLRTRMTEPAREADQAEVDALFGLLRGAALPGEAAKGPSAPTLELVRNAVRAARGDVSAAEVAEEVGVSRPTAQRYLSHLARHGVVRLQLKYGATGRPEHRYTLSDGAAK